MARRAAWALTALGLVLAITAAWWALALWPAAPDAPAWLTRTRAVCFGVADNHLPDTAGWAVLISEPLGMLAFLVLVWRDELREALGALRRTSLGRVVLTAAAMAGVAGVGAATVRVATAEGALAFGAPAESQANPERLDRPAPPLSLVDQRGDTVTLEQFRGHAVLVVFAYGHCETVCPLVVHDALAVVEQSRASEPVLLIVTLDPWRDTPARLASIAAAWRLPPHAHVLSGSVEQVEATLDAWAIARARDGRTGEIVHPTMVHLIDRHGRLAFVARGAAAALAPLIQKLAKSGSES